MINKCDGWVPYLCGSEKNFLVKNDTQEVIDRTIREILYYP